jgi:hypothetical protein
VLVRLFALLWPKLLVDLLVIPVLPALAVAWRGQFWWHLRAMARHLGQLAGFAGYVHLEYEASHRQTP